MDFTISNVSKLSKEETLLRKLTEDVGKATCVQDVVGAMVGQPLHLIEMRKALQTVMPENALLKYSEDIFQAKTDGRMLIQFGKRETVQITMSCLKLQDMLESTLDEILRIKAIRQMIQYDDLQSNPSMRCVRAWVLTSLSICWIDRQFESDQGTLVYQCLYHPFVTDLTQRPPKPERHQHTNFLMLFSSTLSNYFGFGAALLGVSRFAPILATRCFSS